MFHLRSLLKQVLLPLQVSLALLLVLPLQMLLASPATAALGSIASSMSTAVSPNSKTSSTLTTKLLTLNDEDKKRICALYDSLDKRKSWKLKTGTIVEDVIKQVAMSINQEQ